MVRIAELLGALSLATDLGSGQPLETSLRTCVLATRLARRLALPDLIAVRRTTLLRHLGCTAFAHEAARIAGDDHDLLSTFAGVDLTRRATMAKQTMTRLGRGTGFARRVATVAKAVTRPRAGAALIASQCAQAVALAEDLAMPPAVVGALAQIYERHDGRGAPHGVTGDALAPAAKLLHLAELVEVLHRTRGRDAAVGEVRKRRGKHLAPEVADAFLAEADHLWGVLESSSVWDRYLDEDDRDEPDLAIDRIARAFGRYADLKSPHTLGHSSGVAELAMAAVEGDAAKLRVAALLHDLGSVSVPNGIWDKPGPLNAAEWERVRLHGYYTQRILAQTPLLADVAAIAGAHHERLDGTGYHRSVDAGMLDREARILAAADAFQAMQQRRAYREPLSREAAIDALHVDVKAGKLCGRAVDAVIGVNGARSAQTRALPAGLTPREVEVLVMLARGRTNKEIARDLGIAVRTTNHHVENIYAKIDVTTRAAAALFAVRHDLVPL